MIKNRTFIAYVTRARARSKNLTFGADRADMLKDAIQTSAIDKMVVVLVEDNLHVVEEVPAAYFNQFIWHNIQGRPALDMSSVRERMKASL